MTTFQTFIKVESMNVWNHIKRIFLPITSVTPNEQENAKLVVMSTTTNELLANYCVWRRSSLIFACPSIFVSMIFGFVSLKEYFGKESHYSGWGKFLGFMVQLSDLFLLVAIVYAIYYWHQILRSTYAVRIGWAISLVFPVLLAIHPLELIIKKSTLDQLDISNIVLLKVLLAMGYVFQLLPIVITIPGGAVRATLRIRNVFPHSSLMGWILMLSAAFYSLVFLLAVIIIMNIAGDSLLLIGVCLLLSKQVFYVYRSDLFVGINTSEDEQKLQYLLYTSSGLGILGVILVLIWSLSSEVNGIRVIGCDVDADEVCLLTFGDGFKFLFEWIGRFLVNTIFFCDYFIIMALRNWANSQTNAELEQQQSNDDYKAFYHVLKGQWKNDGKLEEDQIDPEVGAEENNMIEKLGDLQTEEDPVKKEGCEDQEQESAIMQK